MKLPLMLSVLLLAACGEAPIVTWAKAQRAAEDAAYHSSAGVLVDLAKQCTSAADFNACLRLKAEQIPDQRVRDYETSLTAEYVSADDECYQAVTSDPTIDHHINEALRRGGGNVSQQDMNRIVDEGLAKHKECMNSKSPAFERAALEVYHNHLNALWAQGMTVMRRPALVPIPTGPSPADLWQQNIDAARRASESANLQQQLDQLQWNQQQMMNQQLMQQSMPR